MVSSSVILSICVPSRNRTRNIATNLPNWIAAAEASIHKVEVLVAISGLDELPAILLPFAKNGSVKFVITASDLSGHENFTRALNEASGKWRILIGDDDEILGNSLDPLIAFLHQSNPSSVVYSNLSEGTTRSQLAPFHAVFMRSCQLPGIVVHEQTSKRVGVDGGIIFPTYPHLTWFIGKEWVSDIVLSNIRVVAPWRPSEKEALEASLGQGRPADYGLVEREQALRLFKAENYIGQGDFFMAYLANLRWGFSHSQKMWRHGMRAEALNLLSAVVWGLVRLIVPRGLTP